MNLDDLFFLQSEAGQSHLAQLAATVITPDNHLSLAAELRQMLPPAQAQAILETALLRQIAAAKFSRAPQMFFTRPALEQASGEQIAHYRARRFLEAGCSTIADLGCSLGGDALALAAQAEVTGVEWDPVRLAMAQHNVAVYGHGERFHPLQADINELTPFPAAALFFDPGRRDERGRRFYSIHEYQPPLTVLERWLGKVKGAAAKISPGVDYAEIAHLDCEVEIISVQGEVKEAVLWFGGLRSVARRRATLLPSGHTLTDDGADESVAVTAPLAYLYEPDGAIIRAGLVEPLARQLGANKIDPDIAYLTGEQPIETNMARCYPVQDFFPFQLKHLRHYLQARDIGQVVIKKRGSPLDPDVLRRQLRLRGRGQAVIFLTHILGQPGVIIGTVS
ncbi:MAG: class I SAM-dependent methyltransferase [Anaerolineae bacterium]|nr:class I SAM-dependent methyltransferase [Anaerolineae bacterium]